MTSSMSTPAVMEDTPTAVKSELLCFVASKTAIMAFDDIVKICASFFREEEKKSLKHVAYWRKLVSVCTSVEEMTSFVQLLKTLLKLCFTLG